MTQAPATPELVERLNEHVRYEYMPAAARLAMEQAADALEAQQARIAELEAELKAALREVGKHAREAGEAIGRLEMSEAAGIVEGWRERAAAAEALADRYEKALRAAERLARSGEHEHTRLLDIRDLVIEALSSQGRHERGEDGLPELPGVNAVPLPASPDGPRSSQSPRVSHGLHMKVVGGKLIYQRKSRIVE